MKRSLGVVLLVLGAACTTDLPPNDPSTTRASACATPLGVPGAQVAVVDTADGVALTFTSQDRVGDLRERARDAAAMYGPGAQRGEGHKGHHGEGGKHGLQPYQLPPATAVMEDVEGGARIRLTPSDAADVDRLRAKARERAEAMAKSCR